jgi:thiamine biosynthesis lipoprotein
MRFSFMKKYITTLVIMLLITALIIPQTACSENAEPVSKESFYFDTVCQISIYDMEGMSEEAAGKVIEGVFRECQKYEGLLSKTVKGSDVWNINHAKGKAVKCDPITVQVIQKGLEFCKMTDGRFDITIGKVDDLWDYHKPGATPPARKALSEALRHVDYRLITIQDDQVRMKDPEAEIDLGAIAKGYIADGLAQYLRDQKVTSAIISLGGNIECVGSKAGEPFNIGIEKPYSGQSEIVGATPLQDGTIVTSGTYERYLEYKGEKYHHILDTDTGYPVKTDVVGVSIKGPAGHSVECDGLSTTCLILGYQEGRALVESMDGFEALFILSDDSIEKTRGFEFEAE